MENKCNRKERNREREEERERQEKGRKRARETEEGEEGKRESAVLCPVEEAAGTEGQLSSGHPLYFLNIHFIFI